MCSRCKKFLNPPLYMHTLQTKQITCLSLFYFNKKPCFFFLRQYRTARIVSEQKNTETFFSIIDIDSFFFTTIDLQTRSIYLVIEL